MPLPRKKEMKFSLETERRALVNSALHFFLEYLGKIRVTYSKF